MSRPEHVGSAGMAEGPAPPLAGYLSGQRLVRARPIASSTPGRPAAGETGPLRVWLTGTGSPAVLVGRAGPSTLIQAGRDLMLVDCGNTVGYQMARLGFDVADLTHVFLTHHHTDHNVDLPFLLMSGWISGRDQYRAPMVIGPPGTVEFVHRLLALHEYDIRARLPHGYDPARLAPDVLEVTDGTVTGSHSWTVKAFRVEHDPVCQAFGYRLDTAHTSVAISGDTKPCANLIDYAAGVDVLIHEVIYPGHGFPEYHTLSTDLGAVATAARARRLVLTHLLPGNLPEQQWLEHVEPQYAGPVSVGTDLMQVV